MVNLVLLCAMAAETFKDKYTCVKVIFENTDFIVIQNKNFKGK